MTQKKPLDKQPADNKAQPTEKTQKKSWLNLKSLGLGLGLIISTLVIIILMQGHAFESAKHTDKATENSNLDQSLTTVKHTILKKKPNTTSSSTETSHHTPQDTTAPNSQAAIANPEKTQDHLQEQQALFSEQQAHAAMHMAETMDAIDQINQAMVAIRISYLELINQQNLQRAEAWLKQAIQPVKQAKLIDEVENALIASINRIVQNLQTQAQPNPTAICQQLTQLQKAIDALAAPITIIQNTENSEESTTKSDQSFWQQWQTNLEQSSSIIHDWIHQSIQIETIDSAQYHTFQHTLGTDFFHQEASLLIGQAALAANYHDQRAFNYACAQLKTQIRFHIQEPKQQAKLIQILDTISRQNVQITPPDYLALFQQIQEISRQLHPENQPTVSTNPTMPGQHTQTIPMPSSFEPPALPTSTQNTAPNTHDTPSPLTFLNVQETIT